MTSPNPIPRSARGRTAGREDTQTRDELAGLTNTRTRLVGSRTGVLADTIVASVRAGRVIGGVLARGFSRVAAVITPLGWVMLGVIPASLIAGYRLGWIELVVIGWAGVVLVVVAAIYLIGQPRNSDGTQVEKLTVKDVPVDGFWSISVYDPQGFFQKNELDRYSLNNLTARQELDGSYTVRFGGCGPDTANCLPIMPGWNYTVRLYRPRAQILSGGWQFPEAQPVR